MVCFSQDFCEWVCTSVNPFCVFYFDPLFFDCVADPSCS